MPRSSSVDYDKPLQRQRPASKKATKQTPSLAISDKETSHTDSNLSRETTSNQSQQDIDQTDKTLDDSRRRLDDEPMAAATVETVT